LARIIGPYLVIIAATLLSRQSELPQLLTDFMHDAPLVLATGAFTLMAGLTIITAHHHWTGAPAIVISLIGIAATLKSAWLLIAPTLGVEITDAVAGKPSVLLLSAGFQLLIGLWLSFVGWAWKA
jgi:hypothetical protein